MIYFIFLFSIVLHELSHIIVAKILDIRIGKIKFKIFGFSAELKENLEIAKINKILFFLSGPLINLFISYIFLIVNVKYKYEIVYTNLILFYFNILPILPLDGAKTIFCLLNFKYDFEKTYIITSNISRILLVILSFIYAIVIFKIGNIEIAFILVYLWYINIKEEIEFVWYLKINKNIRKYLNL